MHSRSAECYVNQNLMKRFVVTNITERFTVTAASKKKGLKKVVA